LQPRIAGLADPRDAPVAQPDVSLVDAARIDHDGVGNDRIEHALIARRVRMLAHPVANDLAATEGDLIAVRREVAFDLDDQIRIAQAQTIARRRTV
jgi:hypothetical protein